MKSVKLDYDEVGSVCLVDKEAFDHFLSQLHRLGISVKTTRLTKRALDGAKAPRKSKRSTGSPRK